MIDKLLKRLAERGCGNAYVVNVSKTALNISGIDDFLVEVPASVSGLGRDLFIYFVKVRSVAPYPIGIGSTPASWIYSVQCDKFKWLYTIRSDDCGLVDSRSGLDEYLNKKITQEFGSVSRGILDAVDLNLSVRGVAW